MDTASPSPSLIDATVADLKEVIHRLEAERADLDVRIQDLNSRCIDWERIRSSVEQNGTPRPRARKGENDRKIAEFYRANPGQGFTLPELSQKTGISWSSTRNVVNKNGRSRYEEREGKWYQKEAKP